MMQIAPGKVAGLELTQLVAKREKPFLSELNLPLLDSLLHLPEAERIEMPLCVSAVFLSDLEGARHPLFGARRPDRLPGADGGARHERRGDNSCGRQRHPVPS